MQGKCGRLGYYWERQDPLARLAAEEELEVMALAREASRRLAVPYVSVDIGQTTEGDWKVIEVGDGQFSGVGQVPIHRLWAKLTRVMTEDATRE